MTLEATMRVPFRFLVSDRDRHGNVRVYFRRDGRKIRIREELGSREFAARYDELCRQAEAGTLPERPKSSRPDPGTLGWLVDSYELSAAFNALEPSTQRTRQRLAANMLAEPIHQGAAETFRDFPLSRLTTPALAVLRDRKAGKPGAANDRVKALRALFKWALENRHISKNPTLDLHKVRVVSSGFHTWSVDEIAQFEARHPLGTKANLAMRLMVYIGARRSDATRLGRQHVREGSLRWTAYKNRNRHPVTVEVPILPPLAEAIDATPTGDMVFLVTEFGKPFSIAGFGNWFRDRCTEANLEHCSAHGLRKAAATLAAEAGATAHQLMAMFGWSSLSEAERYTKAAERRRLAAAGAGALLQGLTRENKRSADVSHSHTPMEQVGQIAKNIK